MYRVFSLCVVALLLSMLLGADTLLAQPNSWPEFQFESADPHTVPRGSGGYFSWIKLLCLLLLYLLWVKTTDWVNFDCQMLGLPYAVWNLTVFAPFMLGLVLALTIPVFAAGFSVVAFCYLVPLAIYIVKRNSIVDPHQRVMTPAHIRFLMSQQAQNVGMNIAGEKKADHERGAPVIFEAGGGTVQQNQSNIIAARQTDGYISAKELIADLIKQRGDKCMLDYTKDGASIRYQIDGVWHESESQEREAADLMLAVFKKMANLKVEERRQRQSGRFHTEFEKIKYDSSIVSQGTQSGERVIIQLQRPDVTFESLRELGMREKMEQNLKEVLSRPSGLMLFSSMPSGGLTTTMRLALRLTDRYMRDFAALQDVASPEPLADSIDLTTYDTSQGQTPEKVLESLLRKEPNAVVVNELPNAETASLLCDAVADNKMIITTVRAKEAVEALLRVLLLKVPASKFAPAVIGVLNQRLIRKLCSCKEQYEPTPQLLQKLGIPSGRIDYLYRPAEPGDGDKVCPHCNGIGYLGRTSIYELLVVDDSIRKVLEQQPKLDVLRQVSRKAGNRTLQQEGVVLVAQGITSVQELSRVLKQ